MSNRFGMTFVAGPEHIDVLGHVNNVVWVQWMETIATAHWETVATDEHKAKFIWVVVRHEVDYRGNIALGQSVVAETFIPAGPVGARFVRHFSFRDERGRELVRAQTTWALIDRATRRLTRVPPELVAPFFTS